MVGLPGSASQTRRSSCVSVWLTSEGMAAARVMKLKMVRDRCGVVRLRGMVRRVIRLERVSKSYGALRALSSVSLNIEQGQLVRLLGANGSGKSTLLGVLGTVIGPSGGRVSFDALGDTPEAVRARLGWLGHGAQSYPALSGQELLTLHLRLHALELAVLPALARRFELEAFWTRPMGTYSRGQAQRVALARAVSHQPKLLLLDEPSTGLDARGLSALEAELALARANGVTIVMVTHDRLFAADLPWRDVTLERGRFVAG